jgi:hypothetical protein
MKKALLICGILSSLFYIFMNIFVPLHNAGYSIASQTVSELSAIDAPTRLLWNLFVIPFAVLVIAFGIGIRFSAHENKRLRVVGNLMILDGTLGFSWPPMHLREVIAAGGGTISDTMHIVFAAVTVLLMILMIGIGAAAFGKTFRMYSIATILVLAIFGALTGMDSPRMSENLPTPLIGVWERINIGVYMIWVIVLAIILLKKEIAKKIN